MKQHDFETHYGPFWSEFSALLDQLDALRQRQPLPPLEQFAADYRRLCHQLALARQRGYSPRLVEQLNQLVLRGHRQLHRDRAPLLPRIGVFLAEEFPRAVRRQWRWQLAAALAFLIPLVAAWLAVWLSPSMAQMMLGSQADAIEMMYADREQLRSAGDDVMMFGYYIFNNISIAFRTFAGGVFFGIGALIVMVFNGGFFGAVSGHIVNANLTESFFTFVIAHGAPELTAIVLAGGAGLRLGLSLLAPGPLSRADAFRRAADDSLPIIWGAFALLLLAAFMEAFWSPRQFDPAIKYGVGALSWLSLYAYLLLAGRERTRE
ncbi:stage II sporulation protein M [Isoalcanivorax beigongshangi]|uniref:Stage II sporulation protein M n=1 Tax=Isoalcanivorax beigongshangi TaxID=3238810 RepID=A0ABV4AIA0_9GAMM